MGSSLTEKKMVHKIGKMDAADIQQSLYGLLPMIGRALILDDSFYQHKDDPYRQAFADNPDDPLMHESDWHRWGVITHSRQVGEARTSAVRILGNVFQPADYRLSFSQVDYLSKWQLCLVIAPVLHDLGKFTKRRYWGMKKDGLRPGFSFKGHEEYSGRIVRNLKHFLTGFGLTYDQVEYLARVSELHFKLGDVRVVGKQSETGFNFAFLESEACGLACRGVIDEFPDMAEEIGAFFAVDSLGKIGTFSSVEARSDADLENLESRVTTEVERQGLPKRYLNAALKLGVDMGLARRYFEILNRTKDK